MSRLDLQDLFKARRRTSIETGKPFVENRVGTRFTLVQVPAHERLDGLVLDPVRVVGGRRCPVDSYPSPSSSRLRSFTESEGTVDRKTGREMV